MNCHTKSCRAHKTPRLSARIRRLSPSPLTQSGERVGVRGKHRKYQAFSSPDALPHFSLSSDVVGGEGWVRASIKQSSQRRLGSSSSSVVCKELDSSLRWNDEQESTSAFPSAAGIQFQQAVIPAKAGIQFLFCYVPKNWIPACAGMTSKKARQSSSQQACCSALFQQIGQLTCRSNDVGLAWQHQKRRARQRRERIDADHSAQRLRAAA